MAMRRAHGTVDGHGTVARHERGVRPHTPRRRARRGNAVDAAKYTTTRLPNSVRLRRNRATSCGDAARTAEARRRRSLLSVYAIAIVFAIHGIISGSFASRVPWLTSQLDLSAGQLGLALLCPALGSAIVIPFGGKVVAAFGGRAVTRVSIMVYSGLLALPAFMPNIGVLCAALLLFGIFAGLSDVAVKAQANALENEMGRSIMSRLFGVWSIGTLIGASIGTVATFAYLDARLHLAWVAAALLVVAGTSGALLPRTTSAASPASSADTTEGAAQAQPKKPRFAMPSRAVLAVAFIGFCAMFGEAAAHSWSSVYIANVVGGGPASGSFAFSAFVACMATGRFAGDNLVQRFGQVNTVKYGGVLAMVGAGTVAISTGPALGFVGFGLLGLGVAVVVPVALSAGARLAPTPSQGIVVVLVAAQLACTSSPAALGGVADALSLPAAFGITALIILPVVLFSRVLRSQTETESATVAAVAAIEAAPSLVPAQAWGGAVGSVPMASVLTAEQYVDFDDATVEIPAMTRRPSETPAGGFHTDTHINAELPALATA